MVFFNVQWIRVRGDCSLCWCWKNCWPSLHKTFHFINYWWYVNFPLIFTHDKINIQLQLFDEVNGRYFHQIKVDLPRMQVLDKHTIIDMFCSKSGLYLHLAWDILCNIAMRNQFSQKQSTIIIIVYIYK